MNFNTLKLIGYIAIFSTKLVASEQPALHPEAVIVTRHVNTSLIQNAYKTMLKIDKKIMRAIDITQNAIAQGPSSKADALFQAEKYSLEKEFDKLKLSVAIFNETSTNIYVNYGASTLKFTTPNLDSEIKFLWNTKITNPEKALATIGVIETVLKHLDESFPLDTSDEELKRFEVVDRDALNLDMPNKITLTQPNDNLALIEGLVDLGWKVKRDLKSLMHLAKLVAQGSQTEDEAYYLDSEYFDKVLAIYFSIYSGDYMLQTNIPLFHDIQLDYSINKQTGTYFFQKMDLATLQLDADNLLDITPAVTTFLHLAHAYQWPSKWIVTGNTVLSNIDVDPSDTSVISSLNLDAKQKALLFRKLKKLDQHPVKGLQRTVEPYSVRN